MHATVHDVLIGEMCNHPHPSAHSAVTHALQPAVQASLFSPSLGYEDVAQGAIGDCFYVTALALISTRYIAVAFPLGNTHWPDLAAPNADGFCPAFQANPYNVSNC